MVDLDLLEAIEIGDDIGPFGLHLARGEAVLKRLAQHQGEERAEHVAALGKKAPWCDVISDLDALDETEIEQDGKRFLIRAQPKPLASLALRATKVAVPPTVRQIDTH